jgi:DNA invertase Pin-like site-specific DNA recombinase
VRLIGYTRVSRVGDREGETFISPDVQREQILAGGIAHGHEIIGWEEDLNRSGKDLDRPGIEAAFRWVEAGAADGIATARLDRFARTTIHIASGVERLEKAGGVLVALDVGLDTSTPTGKLMRGMMGLLAEFELDRIRAGWAVANAKAIEERGTYISHTPPPGYRRTVVDSRSDGTPVYGPLEIDPVEGPVIRELFKRRAKGASIGTLCAWLDEELPRVVAGEERKWTDSILRHLFNREAYLGVSARGDARNENAHPALIEKETWDKIQTSRPGAPREWTSALLAGFLRCHGCGYAVVRAGKDKHGRYAYRCTRRHAKGVCEAPAMISGTRLEEYVREALRERMAADARVEIRGELGARWDAALQGVAEAEEELRVWINSGLLSKIGEDAFVAGFKEREAAVDAARLELEETQQPEEGLEVETSELTDPGVFRSVLRHYVEHVEITKGNGKRESSKMEIVWR